MNAINLYDLSVWFTWNIKHD